LAPNRAELIDRKLLRFVISGTLPYRIVENKEFTELIKALNRAYTIPSRYKFINSIQQTEYLEIIKKIQYDLSNAQFIALTLDFWSSAQHYSYLGITAHYFNENITYCSRMIDFEHLTGRHTNENIESEVDKILTRWQI
jgi:hypothetical protein